MKIVVCLKAVPGVVTGVSISETKDRLEPVAHFLHINETDEYALEEALVLAKENRGAVTAVTVGPASSEEMLYVSLGKGADKAIRVDASPIDSQSTSALLARVIRRVGFDLVLTGLESSDSLAAQVGMATAERLGIPFLFAVTKVGMSSAGKTARVTRELGGGVQEVIEVQLPALLSIQTGIQHLSYAPAAKIFQARRRGIERITTLALGIDGEELRKSPRWQFMEVFTPEVRRQSELIQGEPKEIAAKAMAKIKESL